MPARPSWLATKAPMDTDLLLGLLAMIRPLSQGFRVGFSALRFGACVCCSCARFVRVWVRFVSVGVVCWILVFSACFAVLVLVSWGFSFALFSVRDLAFEGHGCLELACA